MQYGLAQYFSFLRLQKFVGGEATKVDPATIFRYLGYLRKQVGLSHNTSRLVGIYSYCSYIREKFGSLTPPIHFTTPLTPTILVLASPPYITIAS